MNFIKFISFIYKITNIKLKSSHELATQLFRSQSYSSLISIISSARNMPRSDSAALTALSDKGICVPLAVLKPPCALMLLLASQLFFPGIVEALAQRPLLATKLFFSGITDELAPRLSFRTDFSISSQKSNNRLSSSSLSMLQTMGDWVTSASGLILSVRGVLHEAVRGRTNGELNSFRGEEGFSLFSLLGCEFRQMGTRRLYVIIGDFLWSESSVLCCSSLLPNSFFGRLVFPFTATFPLEESSAGDWYWNIKFK